jgi:SecD/SecF fusion protein
MPTAYTGRVLLILAVLYCAVCAIYPRAPFSFFQPLAGGEVSMEHNLRKGIDMVGGTSLLYEIERPEGGTRPGEAPLSERVAAALKKRVDPNGTRSLIWRPQGETRLEIQVPLGRNAAEGEATRDAYEEAERGLSQFITPPAQVIRAIETSTGDDRDRQLDALAGGGEPRRAVYQAVADAYDALQAARDGTVVAEAEAREAYEAAKAELPATNITAEQAERLAGLEDDELRQARLGELADGSFPERDEALRQYVDAARAYEEVRDEIADTATLKRLLRGSGLLQFHIVANDLSRDDPQYLEMKRRLDTAGPRPRAGDELRWFLTERPSEVPGAEAAADGNYYVLVYNTNDRSLDARDGQWSLTQARVTSDNGLRAVGFELDSAGANLFGELSGANIGRPLAIVLDDKIISAPNLNSTIRGSGIITGGEGGFSVGEQEYLVSTLNAGSLPARLSEEPISERTVGPQLGRDNLQAGLVASIAGLVIVGVFLIGYYYLSGVVAFTAVLMNMLIILASMAALQASFTLPSIAGIILSLGMSVDANVLIFERLREEQNRGLSIRQALRNAYDRAFSAILDSNVTTGITALLLYVFGSEEVKGFGLTLLIGIFASLFTALYVTRTIFGLLVDKLELKDLSSIPRTFPKWNALLTPKIDWMRLAPAFGGVSAVLIVIGVSLFAYYFQKGRVLDIEFAGGTTAQFSLVNAMDVGDVRASLEGDGSADDPLADVQVVSIEGGGSAAGTSYEIVVPNQNDEAVTAAVVERLGDTLDVRQPSTFVGSGGEYAVAELYPVTADRTHFGGLPVEPEIAAGNAGAVAFVLRDLEPMLTAGELETRITQQRLRGAYDAEGLQAGVRVEAIAYPAEQAAVVIIGNSRFPSTSADPAAQQAFEQALAEPAYRLLNEAVAEASQLEKVTNVGAAVAREFSRDATVAVVLSVLAIMAYIWVRFGDLKYSTATVVALVHDTLFCLAGMGYAHLLADNFLGEALLLDPFRLNLTMVAAILTVMGFSMNDTVVVFDRIRENRGKYGSLSRGVVNDSINQTLSRTLLTGGTTLVTILVMYIFGGPGIHGFTFAMLVGIITGTYSSIAIASPILILGGTKEEAPLAAVPATA